MTAASNIQNPTPAVATVVPYGDAALLVDTGRDPSPATTALVSSIARAIEGAAPTSVTEVSRAYASLVVRYSPLSRSAASLASELEGLVAGIDPSAVKPTEGRLVELPVCYDAEFAPDLPEVARHAGLTPGRAVAVHAATEYRVGMVGFLPGFAYLLGLDGRLACPRLDVPRARVEAGSVGIAGAQTGIYPSASPGGWRIIGRTPVTLYDPTADKPALLEANDRVRFRPITHAEFDALAAGGTAPGGDLA